MDHPQKPRARRYDIDMLRVLAFSILIFYHVAMYFVADWGWHIKSAYQYDWVKYPMLLVNQWRMPLLFLVSGIASSFLIGKSDSLGFIKSRSKRLLIPFLVGVLLVVPPQAYIQATANGSIFASYGEISYWDFLIRYFTFQEWPENAFDGSDYGFTWNHLWFIPYLFAYTLLLVPAVKLLRIGSIEAKFEKISAVSLILLPVLVQIVWQLTLNDDKDISVCARPVWHIFSYWIPNFGQARRLANDY